MIFILSFSLWPIIIIIILPIRLYFYVVLMDIMHIDFSVDVHSFMYVRVVYLCHSLIMDFDHFFSLPSLFTFIIWIQLYMWCVIYLSLSRVNKYYISIRTGRFLNIATRMGLKTPKTTQYCNWISELEIYDFCDGPEPKRAPDLDPSQF